MSNTVPCWTVKLFSCKKVETMVPALLVLRGYNRLAIPSLELLENTDLENNFTEGEYPTAMHIAESWAKNGWEPILIRKSFDGKFEQLYPIPVVAVKKKRGRPKKAA